MKIVFKKYISPVKIENIPKGYSVLYCNTKPVPLFKKGKSVYLLNPIMPPIGQTIFDSELNIMISSPFYFIADVNPVIKARIDDIILNKNSSNTNNEVLEKGFNFLVVGPQITCCCLLKIARDCFRYIGDTNEYTSAQILSQLPERSIIFRLPAYIP